VIIFLGCGFILFVVTYFASSKVMEMRVKIRREKQELVLQERRQYRERYYGPNSKGVRPSQKSKRSSRQSRSQRETATRTSLEMSEGDKAGGRAEDGGSRVWTIKSLVEVKFDTHTEVKTVLGLTWSTHLVLILVAVIFVIIAIACFSAGGDSWIAGLVFLLIALPCLAGSSFAVDRLRQSNGDGSCNKKKGRGGASVLELGSIEVKTDSRINIEVQNLGLVLNVNGREVLKGVNGTLQSGSVTALMGPSGAGKTTFLNTLSGRATYGVRGVSGGRFCCCLFEYRYAWE
jgi:ABC-type multidrug transport system fused ATPase/permease subunit